MSEEVGEALFRACMDNGLSPDYDALRGHYREAAATLIDAYGDDAAFNGFEFDADGERDQVEAYAEAVGPPGLDRRLPPWAETDLDPEDLLARSEADLDRAARDDLEVADT